MHCEDQDATSKTKVGDVRRRPQSAHTWQSNVENNGIGLQTLNGLNGMFTIVGFTADYPPGPRPADERANAFAHNFRSSTIRSLAVIRSPPVYWSDSW